MSAQRYRDFAKNQDMSTFQRPLLDELRRAFKPLSASVASTPSFSLEGHGWRRVCMVAEVSTPASGVRTYVLDDTQDYRDRGILYFAPNAASVGPSVALYPGHPTDNLLNALSLPNGDLYYTGSGYAEPVASGDIKTSFVGNNLYTLLYAREDDGALVLTKVAGDSVARMNLFLQFMVSPKLGERGLYTPPSIGAFDGVDGAAIHPHDLNNLQDEWMVSQTPASDDTLPLGKLTLGSPPLSMEHVVRGERVRQPLLTAPLTRWVNLSTGADTLIDDKHDWRDRVVSIYGVYAPGSVDIRPGEAAQHVCGTDTNVATIVYRATGYLGSGNGAVDTTGYLARSVDVGGSYFYADAEKGYLRYSSTTGGSLETMCVMVEATPQLGPRSQLTRDAGFDLVAPLPEPSGILVDALSAASPGMVARHRMDRGISIVDGRVAAIADQSGNGRHLRQLDHTIRSLPPEPVISALGMFGLPMDGGQVYEFIEGIGGDGLHLYFALQLNSDASTILFGPNTLSLPDAPEAGIAVFTGGADVNAYLGNTSNNGVATLSGQWTAGNVATLGVNVRLDGTTLVSDIAWRDSGGLTLAPSSISPSPDITSLSELINMVCYGLDGHLMEFAVWDRAMANADDIISDAYSTARYGV